jgi:hypothetical protein
MYICITSFHVWNSIINSKVMKNSKPLYQWIYKITLVLMVGLGFCMESQAQFVIWENKITSVPSAIELNASTNESVELEKDTSVSYINSDLLFLEKSLKVCRDLIAKPKNDTPSTEEPKELNVSIQKDSTSTEVKKQKVKRTSTKIWNMPGTTNSKI